VSACETNNRIDVNLSEGVSAVELLVRYQYRVAIGTALGLAAGSLAAILFLHPSLGPSLASASSDALGKSGIRLLHPFPWDTPIVTKSLAEKVALRHEQAGTPVLESVLAEVINSNPSPRPPQLCWVVSIPAATVPYFGPRGGLRPGARFYVIFVDARSGEYLWAIAGGG
jgi:hypothetical protein